MVFDFFDRIPTFDGDRESGPRSQRLHSYNFALAQQPDRTPESRTDYIQGQAHRCA